eukprot:scaffold192672_cov31-Tisochrysis_lutea.AAC.3
MWWSCWCGVWVLLGCALRGSLCMWRGAARGPTWMGEVPGGGCCGCEASDITWSVGAAGRRERRGAWRAP